ncbi:hypothetical protein F4820DRAFT_430520 [Hypoxylon rubiginosum]|uniref:Uncharacterized protein n=1 Tax=Hypoxylon rubiginosum TaxID=110542 RepID=A0ACB9YTP2_9PEZI|nr:hypothetical protein F4820DRAFT_430520 [Hypoxylon rubiginosum]
MFPTLIRRSAERQIPTIFRNVTAKPSPRAYIGPYKPKKVWPPDFSKLSEKEQFRFERRYKRRLLLATARPRWDKLIRMAQLFSVTSVLIYSVLFMDWQSEKQPFQGVRDKFWGAVGAFSPQQRRERRNPDIAAMIDRK